MAKNIRRELDHLRLPELQQRYRIVVGEETRCPNRTFLIRKIAEALEARAAATPSARPTDESPEPVSAAAPTEEITDTASVEGPSHATTATVESSMASDPADVAAPAAETAAPALTPVVTSIAPVDVRPALVAAPAAAARSTRPRRVPRVDPSRGRPQRGRFKSMTVEELQTAYLSIVGRTTGSTDRRYLIWKIREAEKGNVPVGPRATRTDDQQASTDTRILPLRLDAPSVAAIDATWRAQGFKSRMEFFRRALGHYLAHVGAHGAAAMFGAA